ncbi:MAG: TRAP transporter small permease [Hydrogenophilaceae bacterium]|jgi:TRAP-type C4-dicarboxylate transport system permease small subunit|nr:TRAP transporter small permease [Hydrogenophilaceae bacterium]
MTDKRASVFDQIAASALALAGAALVALVLVLAWQVFGRYVLNDSPGWTEPVALTLMSVAALLGAAIAVRLESHFAFPTLVESAPMAMRHGLKTFARLIALASGLALAGYGAFLVSDAWSIKMAGAPAPEGVAYIGLPLGGALMALFAVERLIKGDVSEERG